MRVTSSTKAAILLVGLAALTAPALAQSGSRNEAPKGSISGSTISADLEKGAPLKGCNDKSGPAAPEGRS